MAVLLVIISLVLTAFFTYAIQYCYDKPLLWKKTGYEVEAFRVQMPQLSDLNICHEDASRQQHIADQYVRRVICPAHEYFRLRSKIENALNFSTGFSMLGVEMYILVPLYLLSVRGIRNLGFTDRGWLCYLVSLVLCGLCYFIVTKYYERRHAIPDYTSGFEEKKTEFGNMKAAEERRGDKPEFDIPYEKELNNYLIDAHHFYLSSIEYTVLKRDILRQILSGVAATSWLLFFQQFYNP